MLSRWTAFATVLVATAISPAIAQTVSLPAAPSAQETLDTPIETIAASPTGCAMLDKDFPGLREHPMYSSFKHMSLNQIAAMSKGQITPAMLAQAQTDLSALSAAAPAAATPIAATPIAATATH